jgi:hypothetical protein
MKFNTPPVGLRFEFPGQDMTGLIAHYVGHVPIGYFFPFSIEDCDDREISPENAVLVAYHNWSPYFLKGEITKSHMLRGFRERDWPYPRAVTSTKWGRGRCKGDLIQNLADQRREPAFVPITTYRNLGVTTDSGIHNLKVVGERVRAVLQSGDPNDGRIYWVENPMPNGSQLLERYMRTKGRCS